MRGFWRKQQIVYLPPSENLLNNHKVGKAEYKNRLQAYIQKTIQCTQGANPELLTKLVDELNRLVKLFNAGLHSNLTKDKVEGAFRDLVLWLNNVIELSPELARRPYLAYEPELVDFIQDLLE